MGASRNERIFSSAEGRARCADMVDGGAVATATQQREPALESTPLEAGGGRCFALSQASLN